MRRLLLLRHAKAEVARPASLRDEARKLAPRGREDAAAMGLFIKTGNLVPDAALVSTAVRTRETFAQVQESWGTSVPVTFDGRIYEASADTLLDIAQNTNERTGAVLVVGHNPGIAALADLLIGAGDASAIARFNDAEFPTTALAVIDFAVESWSAIAPESGWLGRYATPRLIANSAFGHM
jgi:phosphohistidine phosphatase